MTLLWSGWTEMHTFFRILSCQYACQHKMTTQTNQKVMKLILISTQLAGGTSPLAALLGLPSYRSRQGALRSLEAPREKIRHSAGVRKGVKSFEYCHIPINYAHVYGPILHVPCQ